MAVQREQVVQTAEKYVSRGKIEPAIREYRKLLAENPNDINTLNRVGDLYARIQRIDEAVDFFTQIAEQYTAEGFFVKAIAIYKKIIKLNPTRLEVYEKLAELYHKQGLINEAKTQYQVLADYYQKHENAASAIAIYQKMAELEPDNPSYHVKLAEIYHQQQLIEKALGEYRIIAELMISHGHTQEAAQVYQRGLDIDSENLPFITDGVLKLKEAGQVALAKQLLSVAVERNPQAERVAHLAGLTDEPRRAEPAPAPPVAAAPAPAPEPEPPAPAWADLPAVEIEEAEEEAAEEEPPARVLPRWGEPQPGLVEEEAPPAARNAGAKPQGEEFDLDLNEVFVLDMEDDEPASLVKPPADMLGDRRPAWAQGGDSGALAGTAAESEPVEEPAWGGVPSWATEEIDEEASVEVEPEIDLGAGDLGDLVELEVEIELEADEVAAAPGEAEEAIDLGSIDMLDSLPGFAAFEEEATAASEPEPEPEISMFESQSDWAIPDEIEAPLAAAPMPAPAPVEEEAPATIDPDWLDRTAAELHPQNLDREEDLISEAEVLAKYGLEEKALERLREALRLQPRHLGAYALMIQLHLDKGRHARVVELANSMAEIAATARDAEPWAKVRKRLLAAGYRFDGDRVAGSPQVRGEQGVDNLLRGLLGDAPSTPKKGARPAALPVEYVEEAPPASVVPAPPPNEEPPSAAPLEAAPAALAEDLFAELPAAVEAAPAAPAKSPLFDPLSIGEMVENEDDDWMDRRPRTKFSVGGMQAAPAAPVEAPASGGLAGFTGSTAGLGNVPPPSALQPPSPSPAARIDDTGGLSWLDDTASRKAPPASPGGPTASDLFDDENDFFDLAGELEQELSQEDVFQQDDLLMPSEQSLEEIVEGFKKGVAEHLSPTDYETHFNLGIAYREMGLLDEAIGEFQLASKSPTHLVSCCSMLGICFLDKGLPALAVKWYRRGLEAPGLNEEDNLGLLYDLGCAYLTVGDTESAYKTFVELYGVNSNYRDVVARLEELAPR